MLGKAAFERRNTLQACGGVGEKRSSLERAHPPANFTLYKMLDQFYSENNHGDINLFAKYKIFRLISSAIGIYSLTIRSNQ